MWLVFAGRLQEEFKDAIGEYVDRDIDGSEMLEEYEGREYNKEVKSILVMDAGLHSLKDWQPLRNLSKKYKGVPVTLYIRNKGIVPTEDVIGEDIKIEVVETDVYIGSLVTKLERREEEYKTKEGTSKVGGV